MRDFIKKAWGAVRTLWSRIAKAVDKFLDDFSMRRVRNMKGYKVVDAATQASAPQDSVAIQMDELDDWNVVHNNVP